ncbi:hypothetical protein EVAR_85658_1 [Eumeta japonica]|uniref:Uncharacterized protein n=1 Tax=Eumeta variegata TaxID=151549 RepID=A0A4C1XRK8_EUMVA|nr:hypothetical protein EVAR_85658_1 [Eumeta japonica]
MDVQLRRSRPGIKCVLSIGMCDGTLIERRLFRQCHEKNNSQWKQYNIRNKKNCYFRFPDACAVRPTPAPAQSSVRAARTAPPSAYRLGTELVSRSRPLLKLALATFELKRLRSQGITVVPQKQAKQCLCRVYLPKVTAATRRVSVLWERHAGFGSAVTHEFFVQSELPESVSLKLYSCRLKDTWCIAHIDPQVSARVPAARVPLPLNPIRRRRRALRRRGSVGDGGSHAIKELFRFRFHERFLCLSSLFNFDVHPRVGARGRPRAERRFVRDRKYNTRTGITHLRYNLRNSAAGRAAVRDEPWTSTQRARGAGARTTRQMLRFEMSLLCDWMPRTEKGRRWGWTRGSLKHLHVLIDLEKERMHSPALKNGRSNRVLKQIV